MADRSRLYKAYGKAGKASSKYKASLYDIEGLEYEKEASRQQFAFDSAQRDRNLALISEGIGLASDIVSGTMSRKEFKKDSEAVQKGMAKKGYKGEKRWENLTEDEINVEMDKYKPQQVKQSFGDWAFGAEKQYTFGGSEDKFTRSQVSAAAQLYSSDRLSKLIGADTVDKAKDAIKDIQEKQSTVPKSETKSDSKSGSDAVTVDEIFSGESEKVDAVDLSTNEGADEIVEDIQANVQKITTNDVKSQNLKTEDELVGVGSNWLNLGDFDFGSAMGGQSTEFKRFAEGGEYTTDGPELILVGDNPGGKEKVKVTPIKSKGKEKLADNIGVSLKDLVSKKGSKPGSKKWMNEYISNQKINNESLRPLQGELSKHNKKLFSMAEESGYFGEFFRGGWE